MGMPSRVLYLPPGVVPGPSPVAAPAGIMPSGLPFDRNFFEKVLAESIKSFCAQVPDCKDPVVELLTVDGATHYVRGISGVADTWVALHTRVDHHDHDIQIFVPYASIFRVAIHAAEDDHKRRLGFVVNV